MPEYGGQWCHRCDLPKMACEHGLDAAVVAAFDNRKVVHHDLVADGPTITASQTSPCPGCTRDIEPDEQITHTEHGWAHTEHVAPKPLPPKTDLDWGGFV